jgi:triosephosphate isomerase
MWIIANWKMQGNVGALRTFCEGLIPLMATLHHIRVVVCVPFPYLLLARDLLRGTTIVLGAQDISPLENGPHTGDVSAAMVKDVGASCVILGHSERRRDHGEGCSLIHQKALLAKTHGLMPILCVGDAEGQAQSIITRQVRRALGKDGIAGAMIAYEPLWAIGTGKAADEATISKMHRHINQIAPDHPVLYGGSVTADNVGTIVKIPHVSGVLVGGASVRMETFAPLLLAADKARAPASPE